MSVVIYECPGGCPPGQCDTKGLGDEGRWPCAYCGGTGIMADDIYGAVACERCNGDGLGGFYSTATCSKCGQRAIDRAMWEAP